MFVFLALACRENDPFPKLDFDGPPEEVVLDPAVLPLGEELRVAGKFIILFDVYARRHVFSVYDGRTNELLRTVGEVGGGPDQFTQVGFSYLDKQGGVFWVADVGKGHLKQYDLDSLVTMHTYSPMEIPYPDKISFIQGFATHGGDSFVAQAPDFYQNLLVRFDNLGIQDTIGSNVINEDLPLLGDYFRQNSYSLERHPQMDLYACAYRYYDILRIVDPENDRSERYQGPLNISYSENAREEIAAFRRIRTTANHIFAEFVGQSPLNEDRLGIRLAEEILVFDWEGRPVGRLDPGVPIVSFDVDEANNSLLVKSGLDEDEFLRFRVDPATLSL